jgi:dienelactone hydrolase
VELEYGGLPPAPTAIRFEPLHTHTLQSFQRALFTQYRVFHADEPSFHFRLDLIRPEREGPFPAVLTGDGCYRYATDEVIREILRRGFLFAQFSRVEIVPDLYHPGRASGLYAVYPRLAFGALAAWAWGFHRTVDVLCSLPFVDRSAIGVTGHSRGGKAALLAGATDTRIAVTAPNGSGCGGAGSFYLPGPGAEQLADILRAVPYWFGPRLKDYIGRDQELPFDQHFLKAVIAPRALVSVEGLDDHWANPTGTWQTHLAAREVFRFLGVPDRIGIRFRPGGHGHSLSDWVAFLDFMEWQVRGTPPLAPYDANPFPDQPPAFSWKAPRGDSS